MFRTVFLGTILYASILVADSQSFLLPDRMHDAEHHLSRIVRKAGSSVVIATPSLRDNALSGAVADAAERGIAVTLITSAEPGEAAALVRYANVRLLLLEGVQADDFAGRLKMTLLLADTRIGCLGTLPLTREALAHDIGVLECSDEASSVQRYGAYIETMIRRSSPYLKQ